MIERATMPLTDVLEFREGPGIMARDFRDSGVPLLRLAGLKTGAPLLEGCNFLDPRMVDAKWNHFRVEVGDVLLSTSASLGEVATVDESAVGAVPYTGIINFRPRDDRMSPRFIRFALTERSFKLQVEAMGVGSVMRHFGPSHLRKMTVTVPHLAVQEGIADVLGALDDKIAANTVLASSAEGLANALFTQSVSGAELSDSTFGDIAAVRGGGTPRTGIEEYWDGDINWVTPTDVTALSGPYLESTSRRITKLGLESCASPLYPAGSILMTSRATIGAFAVAQQPTATNQGFIVVNPHDPAFNWWIFHEMRSRVDEFISLANGATFLELSRGNFKKFRVRLADESTMKQFGITADALHAQARQAFVENARLADAGDVLLPMLMSGKIRVKEAAQMVGDVV